MAARIEPADTPGTWSFYQVRKRDMEQHEAQGPASVMIPVEVGWMPRDTGALHLYAKFTPAPGCKAEPPDDGPSETTIHAKNKVLTLGWNLRHTFAYNATRQRRMALFIESSIILFTLAGTVSSCLLSYLSLRQASVYDSAYDVLFPLNLLLPLVVTVMIGVSKFLSPYEKHDALKQASIKLESEIYKYRAGVGLYSEDGETAAKALISNEALISAEEGLGLSVDEAKDEGAGAILTSSRLQHFMYEEKMTRSRRAFCGQLQLIWRELGESKIKDGALVSPPVSLDPIDEIRQRCASNLHEQQSLSHASSNHFKKKDDGSPHTLRRSLLNFLSVLFASSRVHSGAESSVSDPWVVSGNSWEAPDDDGFSDIISSAEFIRLRLLPVKAEMSAKVPRQVRILAVLTTLTGVLNVGSTVLAALALIMFIPVINAFLSSLSEFNRHNQTERRLERTRKTLDALHVLVINWNKFPPRESRVRQNFESLVMLAEEAITHEGVKLLGPEEGEGSDEGAGAKEIGKESGKKSDKEKKSAPAKMSSFASLSEASQMVQLSAKYAEGPGGIDTNTETPTTLMIENQDYLDTSASISSNPRALASEALEAVKRGAQTESGPADLLAQSSGEFAASPAAALVAAREQAQLLRAQLEEEHKAALEGALGDARREAEARMAEAQAELDGLRGKLEQEAESARLAMEEKEREARQRVADMQSQLEAAEAEASRQQQAATDLMSSAAASASTFVSNAEGSLEHVRQEAEARIEAAKWELQATFEAQCEGLKAAHALEIAGIRAEVAVAVAVAAASAVPPKDPFSSGKEEGVSPEYISELEATVTAVKSEAAERWAMVQEEAAALASRLGLAEAARVAAELRAEAANAELEVLRRKNAALEQAIVEHEFTAQVTAEREKRKQLNIQRK